MQPAAGTRPGTCLDVSSPFVNRQTAYSTTFPSKNMVKLSREVPFRGQNMVSLSSGAVHQFQYNDSQYIVSK